MHLPEALHLLDEAKRAGADPRIIRRLDENARRVANRTAKLFWEHRDVLNIFTDQRDLKESLSVSEQDSQIHMT